nr:hypothetical protein [Tanacetum cinerariifolium]
VNENSDVSIAKEKEEVQVKDVEMDEDYDIDHPNTEETDLERSCTSRNIIACYEVAPVKYRNLVYPSSDEEDEEYCSMPPLLRFQTPPPCTKFN